MSSKFFETENLFGIFEGKRKARIEEEKRKTAAQAAELAIKTKAAGILSAADVQAETQKSNTNMYLILGVAMVIIVVVAVYFKFRKR